MRNFCSLPIRGFAAFITYVAGAGGAPSTDACDVTSSHVVVHFSGEWDRAVKDEALSDLSAALAPQQMSVCSNQDDAATPRTAAVVTTHLLEGDRVRIEVDDVLTKKRVSRDVSLKDPKDNSSALIVAVAIDELLRATWAELSLGREASPEREREESASEEQDAAIPALSKARPKRVLPRQWLGLGATVDFYPQASTFWGGDVVYGRSVGDIVEWTVYAGPRVARSARASSLGEVQAEAVALGGVLGAPLLRQRGFSLGPEISLQANHAWFRGRANRSDEVSAEGGEFRGWSVAMSAGLCLRAFLGHAFLNVATRAGMPVLALEVTDDDGLVGGMSGLKWNSQAQLGWWWE